MAPTVSRGLRAEIGRAWTGSSETKREGDGELGEGAVGEGAREKGEGKGEEEGGPLRRRARGLPAGKGRAGGKGARRAAAAAANEPAVRRNAERGVGGGGAEGRGWLNQSGLPLPEVGGVLAAEDWSCSLCSWVSHSDRRHFTAPGDPSSLLPPSSSPLTLLPVVTCIRFTGSNVPPLLGLCGWG